MISWNQFSGIFIGSALFCCPSPATQQKYYEYGEYFFNSCNVKGKSKPDAREKKKPRPEARERNGGATANEGSKGGSEGTEGGSDEKSGSAWQNRGILYVYGGRNSSQSMWKNIQKMDTFKNWRSKFCLIRLFVNLRIIEDDVFYFH